MFNDVQQKKLFKQYSKIYEFLKGKTDFLLPTFLKNIDKHKIFESKNLVFAFNLI